MALSKGEHQAALRAKLEAAVRDRRQILGEKAEAMAGFKEALKDVDDRLDGIILELDEGQAPLPFGDGDETDEL